MLCEGWADERLIGGLVDKSTGRQVDGLIGRLDRRCGERGLSVHR